MTGIDYGTQSRIKNTVMNTENELQKEIKRMDKEQTYSAGEKIAIAIVVAIALYGIIGTLLA